MHRWQYVKFSWVGTHHEVVCGCATGCLGAVSTTIHPDNAWNVPFIHNAFENAGATMSGVEAAFKAMKRAGKIPAEQEAEVHRFRW